MKKILPLILIATFLITACGGMSRSYAEATSAPDEYMYDMVSGGSEMEQAPMDMPASAPMPTAGVYEESTVANAADGSNVAAAQVQRMVIQNADLAIVVSDVEARMKEIGEMAAELGGFVVSSNLYQSYTSQYVEVPEGSMLIRVPSEKLEEALKLIKTDAIEIQSESRSGQDVTAEYVDLKSRLKNLEAAETQLEDIMKNATETEDVVNVFNQLVYYREQIELVKGQMEYYEDSVALSAISIRIIAEETIQPIEVAGWEPKGVVRDAIQDLIYFFQDFVDFIIYFIINTLPKLIVIGIPLYLIFLGLRAVYRKVRSTKKKEEVAVVVEEKVEKKSKK